MKKRHVKRLLRKQGVYQAYKARFKHPQTRWIMTLIAFEIKPTIKSEEVAALESALITAPHNSSLYEASFKMLQKLLPKLQQVNFSALAQYFWYVFQTSTYYHDEKHQITNIYRSDDYNQVNSAKRIYFNRWINSYKKLTIDYNQLVMKILKKVL